MQFQFDTCDEARYRRWIPCRPEGFVLSALAILVLAVPLRAEEPADPATLTLERIFSSSEFDAERFGPVRWLERRGGWTALEEPDEGEGRDVVLYNPATGDQEVIVPARRFVPPGESSPLSIASYAWSEDASRLLIFTNTKRVWRRNTRGDYWVLDITSRELRKLGGDAKPSTLMFAKFSPDGRRIAYVRKNNIYVEDLYDRQITAVTTDGSDTTINGTFDWVYEEELGLRDGFRWSPDSKSIAYWQLDTSGVRVFHLINNTDGLYPRLIPIPYPKVGEKNSASRVGVVSADGGPTQWIDVPGDPRNHYIARMEWAENNRELVVQQLNRLQNENRVMLGDVRTGQVRPILTERDKAWVEIGRKIRWLDDGAGFVWLSERDGWRHVYHMSRSGENIRLITPGPFDVVRVDAIDEEGGWLYYTASPDAPTERYLYRVRLDGRGAERISPTNQSGTHAYRFTPDARWALHTFSTFDTPPITELVCLPEHKRIKLFVDNAELCEKLDALDRKPVEFFRVEIEEGVALDGWHMKPPTFDPDQRYPLFIYVYGEPAGQSVLNRWSGKRYLWHLMLTQCGYLMMCVDNRGTPAPRGRAWRKCIYRQVGILASADQAAATRAVIERWSYVDADRIGIWGWSGGGSMTLNAIFRYPDLYHTAMAVAPVPNQRFYDTIYQERYMGLPSDNVEGFDKGSPVTYAHHLEGNLLIVHGTGDDNCHYQGTETLINELIAANKRFTMMAYPNRTHSIREGKNTTRHLYELLTSYLTDNLLPGPAEPK